MVTRNYTNVLHFPEPKIVYLYNEKDLPDEEIITLDFGGQGTFDYHVPVYKLIESSPQELDEQNMIILIPFMILRLRERLEKSRSRQDINDLKSLIFNDILGLIKKNLGSGNITAEDANQLWSMVVTLYRYLYAKYTEFEKEGLNKDMDDELILDFDLIQERIRENLREEVAAQEQLATIKKLYSKLHDSEQVALLLDLPLETVLAAI